jgi:hypothetical protein
MTSISSNSAATWTPSRRRKRSALEIVRRIDQTAHLDQQPDVLGKPVGDARAQPLVVMVGRGSKLDGEDGTEAAGNIGQLEFDQAGAMQAERVYCADDCRRRRNRRGDCSAPPWRGQALRPAHVWRNR